MLFRFRSSVVERAFRKRKVPCSIHGESKFSPHGLPLPVLFLLGLGASDKGGSSGGGVISVLGDMLAAAAAFVSGLAEALVREGVPDLGDLPAAAYVPFQAQLDRYVSLLGPHFGLETLLCVGQACEIAKTEHCIGKCNRTSR